LCYSFRHEEVLKHPDRFSELVTRYEQWPAAAEKSGTQWRAMYVDRITPFKRNEQFISTALEVETPAGYLGHVWPRALERHLYGEASAPIDDVQRYRRRSTLSVRWLISTSHAPDAEPVAKNVVPEGVDGNTLVENELARPRAIEPSVVAAVYGDEDSEIAYLMLDTGTFPILEASTLQLRDERELSPEELAGIDALIVRGPPSPAARRAAEEMRAAGKSGLVLEVGAELSEEEEVAVLALEHQLAVLAETREPSVGRLVRLASDATRIERTDSARGRWLVVSEAWSTYAGWSAKSAADGMLPIDRADGISSAVFVPAGTSEIRVDYAPRSARLGLWCYAAGLLLALTLILWRE
jgi:hypothetical protein